MYNTINYVDLGDGSESRGGAEIQCCFIYQGSCGF